ncbi:hypothetical protein JW721_00985 [Candidatus Micrarchaeota archaeon]|nr:hypothetical protein [Candidatus Micrarchaeota archaeon]
MKILLGLFMAFLLLLAGCPQEKPGMPPQGGPGNGSMPPGGMPGEAPPEGAPENGSLPPQGGPGEGALPSGEEQQASGSEGSASGTGDFADWDLASMMGLGQSVHCSVRYNDGSISSESELYLKGEKMRVEAASVVEGDSFNTKMIMVGNLSYISMDAAAYGLDEDCEWVMLDFEQLQECMPESMREDSGASTEAFDFSSEYADAPSDFSCSYATFGDEMFTPEGKVCDLTEELCSIYDMLEAQGS